MRFERVAVSKDLLKVKDLVCRRENVWQGAEHETVTSHVEELGRRMNELETMIRAKKSKSATVYRRKKQIAYLVRQRGHVSASDVSKALGISRNRANEYLKGMERSGLLEARKNGRLAMYSAGGRG